MRRSVLCVNNPLRFVIRSNQCQFSSLCKLYKPQTRFSVLRSVFETSNRHSSTIKDEDDENGEDHHDLFSAEQLGEEELEESTRSPESMESELQDLVEANVSTFQELQQMQREAAGGSTKAMIRLGMSYLYGVPGLLPPDVDKGMTYLLQAEKNGNLKGLGAIGRYYHIQESFSEAFSWYLYAAQKGDASSQWEVAHRLESGIGVEPSLPKALVWYQKAAEKDPRASHNLGVLYLNGEGVPQDIEKAKELFMFAAEEGVGESYYHLCLLEKSVDPEKSNKYLKVAAQLEVPEAQYNLGNMLDTGEIPPSNPRVKSSIEATGWYSKAAKYKFNEAIVNLAYRHFYGYGTPQDFVKAISLFREIADEGQIDAQWTLAICYGVGVGANQNLSNARFWLKKLSQSGHSEATKLLRLEDAELTDKLGNKILKENNKLSYLSRSLFPKFIANKKKALLRSQVKNQILAATSPSRRTKSIVNKS